jgi:UDP-N-acetylglucosamine 2-epimerase (non-hydrolysing)
MPEEINRIVTDAVADLLLVSEASGVGNLEREGIASSKIRLVGNVMIDTLVTQLPIARSRHAASTLGLKPQQFGFVTLHRPSNVDRPEALSRLLKLFQELARQLPLVFAIHPRTVAAAARLGLEDLVREGQSPLMCVGPQSYLDALSLMADAAVILTDSGGLQEEASVLAVPCITLRENTERPVTTTLGTSQLVGNDPARIREAFEKVLGGSWTRGQPIPLWDGRAGERVAAELFSWASTL